MLDDQQSTKIRLTDAQRRAIAWLPTDGAYRANAGRLTAALNSLSVAHPTLIELESANYAVEGASERRWRLTPAGQKIKNSMDAQ
jgi:hypothetical protein